MIHCRKCKTELKVGANWRGPGSNRGRLCSICESVDQRRYRPTTSKRLEYQERRNQLVGGKSNEPTKCRKCAIPLIEGTNWYGRGKTRGRICNDCWNAYLRNWMNSTDAGQKFKQNRVHYMRHNYLGFRTDSGNPYVRIIGKREWPGFCEMCESVPKRLVYHHWNDADYSQGIWICQPCHNIAHGIEKDLDKKYRELKARLSLKAVS